MKLQVGCRIVVLDIYGCHARKLIGLEMLVVAIWAYWLSGALVYVTS
jgi:hypothetical protein